MTHYEEMTEQERYYLKSRGGKKKPSMTDEEYAKMLLKGG